MTPKIFWHWTLFFVQSFHSVLFFFDRMSLLMQKLSLDFLHWQAVINCHFYSTRDTCTTHNISYISFVIYVKVWIIVMLELKRSHLKGTRLGRYFFKDVSEQIKRLTRPRLSIGWITLLNKKESSGLINLD